MLELSCLGGLAVEAERSGIFPFTVALTFA